MHAFTTQAAPALAFHSDEGENYSVLTLGACEIISSEPDSACLIVDGTTHDLSRCDLAQLHRLLGVYLSQGTNSAAN